LLRITELTSSREFSAELSELGFVCDIMKDQMQHLHSYQWEAMETPQARNQFMPGAEPICKDVKFFEY
jgi:hypothetical protein